MANPFSKSSVESTSLQLADILPKVVVPSFPAAVGRALQVIREPSSSPQQIADAIHSDPGLVVRVLSTVNSAAYGLRNPVRDLSHAVRMMGRSELESLVLAIAVRGAVPSTNKPGFESNRFWTTAAQRATFARILAQELHPGTMSQSFTIGLLQDIAIPVIATGHPERYGRVLERWHTDSGCSLHDLEAEEFGWSHSEVGGLLGSSWHLPELLTASIAGHHVELGPETELPPAIQLVGHLRETAPDVGVERLIESAQEHFGLKPDWTLDAAIRACEQAIELAQLLR